MILATHALTGAAIGKNIENPLLIIIVSLIVHYLMDSFRHGEYLNRNSSIRETWWKISLDIFIGISVITTIAYYQNLSWEKLFLIYTGVFFSMLPDLFTLLYWKFKFNFLQKLFNFHTWIHKHPPFSKEREWNFRNSVNDIIFSVITILLLLF